MKTSLQPLCVAFGLSVASGPTMSAADTNSSASVIPQAFHVVAKNEDMSAIVLYAIGLIETGRDLAGVGRRPYPWVLGIPNRKSAEWFDTEKETVERLEQLIEEGETNIDIGLMQVNWHWHNQRFDSPADAVNPYRNLEVAAKILKEAWRETGDWWHAVGQYHSRTPETSEGYRERYGRWLMRTIMQLEGHRLVPES